MFAFDVRIHSFVNVVLILDYSNTKWTFLDGVKNSGAPPPRSVIVQQCIRDMQVLEALCDYVSGCYFFFFFSLSGFLRCYIKLNILVSL